MVGSGYDDGKKQAGYDDGKQQVVGVRDGGKQQAASGFGNG